MSPPIDIVSSCASKRRYDTRGFAEIVARDCYRQRGHVLRVYSCSCGGFHLTSSRVQPPPVRDWRPDRVSQRDEAANRYWRQDDKRRRRR